jgi:hypothetical protein
MNSRLFRPRFGAASLVAGILLCLLACGRQVSPEQVELAASVFQSRLQSEDYATIYDEGDPVLRQMTTKEQFLASMHEVRTSLGPLIERRRTSGYELQRLGGRECQSFCV